VGLSPQPEQIILFTDDPQSSVEFGSGCGQLPTGLSGSVQQLFSFDCGGQLTPALQAQVLSGWQTAPHMSHSVSQDMGLPGHVVQLNIALPCLSIIQEAFLSPAQHFFSSSPEGQAYPGEQIQPVEVHCGPIKAHVGSPQFGLRFSGQGPHVI
jgi:hypothetical protein